MDERIENQEIYCHNCGKYVQFQMDLSLNGNHVLNCPNCGHEHCRVVKNGVITDDRWAQRNGMTYQIFQATTSATSTSSTNGFTFQSWGTSASSTGYAIITGT